MVPAGIHEFFGGAAGVAGALIGLLFVAISVASDRLTKASAAAQIHRIRAYAALTSFVNALVVSLFALIPGDNVGYPATVMAIAGLLFVAASLLSLFRLGRVHWTILRDALFLVGLAVLLVFQLISGLDLLAHPGDSGTVNTIATLVVICFTIGIARAWQLIGGPSIGLRQEVVALARHEQLVPDQAETAKESGTGAAPGPETAGAPRPQE